MGRRRSACKGLAALPRHTRRAQRGAYAVEFAFTFLFLFIILYAGIALAVAFAGNQLLALAAEDGARAALRAGTEDERRDEACRIARARTTMFTIQCDARAAQTNPGCDMSAMAAGVCFHVIVTADTPIPQVPFLNAVLPARLTGHATVRLDSMVGLAQ